MHVGDLIRLCGRRARRILGVPRHQVGVVKSVDAGSGRTAVLISFPGMDVYTSALDDNDVEVVRSDVSTPTVTPDREM